MKRRATATPISSRLIALAALVTLTHPSVQAVGRLADVSIVDRDTGAPLPVHYARGEYWVAGRPGARYAIAVRNRTGERLLAVPAVDGINVLSGETADWNQRGYVFSPHERYEITGWRKSSREVAVFEFSKLSNSYAARTGRPAHVGVIGVALFREQPPVPPPPPAVSEASAHQREHVDDTRQSSFTPPPVPAPAPAPTPTPSPVIPPTVEPETPATASPRSSIAPKAAERKSLARLGTAHGERETSVVTHTTFTRLQEHPNEIITIRYDSRENLIAYGVIREQRPKPSAPRAFPGSQATSYVPDPQ